LLRPHERRGRREAADKHARPTLAGHDARLGRRLLPASRCSRRAYGVRKCLRSE
jgi:hypothetical protein